MTLPLCFFAYYIPQVIRHFPYKLHEVRLCYIGGCEFSLCWSWKFPLKILHCFVGKSSLLGYKQHTKCHSGRSLTNNNVDKYHNFFFLICYYSISLFFQQLALKDPAVRAKLGLPDNDKPTETANSEDLGTPEISPLASPTKLKKISLQNLTPKDLVNVSIINQNLLNSVYVRCHFRFLIFLSLDLWDC